MLVRKYVVLLVGVLMLYVNPVSASLFGCSADRQRCLNECAEKHRGSAIGGIKATGCKARCLLSECLFYPRKEKKSAHPSDRLRGFAI